VTGVIQSWASDIVRQLSSYTEVSPSGTGLHIIVQARLPAGGRRTGHVEMYDRARFFTMTGNRVDQTATAVEARQAEIDALHAKTFAKKRVAATASRRAPADQPHTVEAIRSSLPRRAQARFDRLWSGDTAGYPSPSEADLALCVLLVTGVGDDE